MHSQDFLKELGKAFKQGKAGDIAAHFDKNVDLFFSEKTTTYTKKEAEQVIRKFFTQVEPTDFMKTNDGASQANNTIFYIGTLNTSYGSYQVYMFFVLKNATYYIRELRFEKK